MSRATLHAGPIGLLITACFFFSGLAGLVYEVVWARQLALFLGITSYAHTAVITAYMAGLAAGSLYFGHRADQGIHPLKTYAWLEVGVGVYAAFTPWLIPILQNGYVRISSVDQISTTGGHLARFSIALLALLLPTFLMGGTLPLLVRGFVNELSGLGKATSRLYGINTLGAMTGTLLAGYLLLPMLGIKFSIYFAVALNLGIAVLVLSLIRHLESVETNTPPEPAATDTCEDPQDRALSDQQRFILLAGFGIAGFAALLTQMAWIRALSLVVGGSVYAFTITLASFLGGIGLGSLAFRRFLASPGGKLYTGWLKDRMAQSAVLAVIISLTLLLGLPLIGKMPGWFLAAYSAGLHKSFPVFQVFIFAMSFGLMIVPTLCMGALLPLVTVTWTTHAGGAGRGIGIAYAVNTTGTILGALFGGLFILPWLGIHHGVLLAAALYFLVAAAYWLFSDHAPRPVIQIAPVLTAGLVLGSIVWSIPAWNRELMVSGVFQAPRIALEAMRGGTLPQLVEQYDLLYYREGRDGTVAVRRNGDQRSLIINGKTDASSHNDLPTQIMLAQLPLALNREMKKALVIGLGSGITAGSLAASPELEQLRILEISAEVVEASAFFESENRRVLDDPRTELMTADARNFLMASPDRYDLIVSEPSNPWLTGISNLFTDEFLALAKSRLNPGGVMTQWFHTYGMSNADLRTLLNTFGNNFEYVTVWTPMLDDIVIIGSDEPHAIGLTHDMTRARELSRARLENDRDLVKLYLFGGKQLSSYVADSPINSDNHPLIEFNAPHYLYAETSLSNMSDIISFLGEQEQPVPIYGMIKQSDNTLDAYFIGLEIAFDRPDKLEAVNPAWTITHRATEKQGKNYSRVIGSERLLHWREGPSRYRIRASWRENVLAEDALNSLVQNMSAMPGREARMIQLHGDIDAAAVMSRDVDDSGALLVITWQCPARPDGVTHYVLRANLADPGRDAWNSVIESQATRLRCK